MSTLTAKPASTKPHSSVPSRTATPISSQDAKRKKTAPTMAPSATIWSQPADSATSTETFTHVTYALDYLRTKEGQAFTADEIINHLNVFDDNIIRQLRLIFKKHPKIEYDPQGAKGKGSFRFRPTYGVRTGDDLLAFLQKQTTAQGIRVNALKEGWSGALDNVETLEKEGKLLVTRNKKDNSPKMVWPNDPTLIHEVDNDFRNLWHDVQVPGTSEALRNELLAANLTPTSQVKKVAVNTDAKKKKKMPRSGGRTTNTHMAHVLKDYSHLRRG